MGMESEEVSELEGKSGKDLFLELFRLLPSAQVEDYYQLGRWKGDDIRLDFELLQAHRREAGAEDPPTLEELANDIPQLPENRAVGGVFGAVRAYPVSSGGTVAAKPASAVRPACVIGSAAAPLSRPQLPKATPTSAMVAAAGSGGPGALRFFF